MKAGRALSDSLSLTRAVQGCRSPLFRLPECSEDFWHKTLRALQEKRWCASFSVGCSLGVVIAAWIISAAIARIVAAV